MKNMNHKELFLKRAESIEVGLRKLLAERAIMLRLNEIAEKARQGRGGRLEVVKALIAEYGMTLDEANEITSDHWWTTGFTKKELRAVQRKINKFKSLLVDLQRRAKDA